MSFTPAQETAIYTLDRNLIVVAGAGSGKTRVLVERYLTLLETHEDWELNQLVAITFTQKAAQEMRDRVRGEMQKKLDAAYAAQEMTKASVWARRLTGMDSARIDTIHALCTTILRQNAAEAGIDPLFEVLDETGARILLESTLDALISSMAAASDPTATLFREYRASDIRTALISLVNDSPAALPGDLLAAWQAMWQAEVQASMSALQAHEAVAYAAGRVLPTGEDRLLDVWRITQMHVQTLHSTHDPYALVAALRGLKENIKLSGGTAGFWGSKEAVAEEKALLKVIRELAESLLARVGEPPNAHDQRAAALLPLWLRLQQGARAAYIEAKRERGSLDFDDLEARTRWLLLHKPHIRQRYASGEFQHLLVDEFQDTNAAQWDIIRLLAAPEAQGRLFVVGDPKQSIYSFRGADVSVFDQVRGEILTGGGEQVLLGRSFRTHAPLVACFNALFARLLVRDDSSPAAPYQITMGEPMDAARQDAPDVQPFLELTLIDTTDAGENASEQGRIAEAFAVAERIQALVEAGTPIYDRDERAVRPLDYGDCALLFRSMNDVPLYENAFKTLDLPYVTVAGKGYYDRQEVWDLLNLLRALYHPGDMLALAAALRSPLFALSDDALFALRLRRDAEGNTPPLWEALAAADGVPQGEHERLAFAHSTLTTLRRLAGRVTIAELLEAALDATGYLAVVTGLPDGARRRGNIEKLLEKARSSGKLTLGEFSHYLDDLSAMEAREGEATLDSAGAITLMTIHKSKGLEFPLVFLVDVARGAGGHEGVLLHEAGLGLACKVYDADEGKDAAPYLYRKILALREAQADAESRRLLYVAATRAQDRLFISGQAGRKKDGGWSTRGWLGQVMAAFALEELERDTTVDYEWGRLLLRVLPASSAPDERTPLAQVARWQVDEGDAAMPPLLKKVQVARDASARSLSATQIMTLGAYHADLPTRRSVYRQRWQRSLARTAVPDHIERVTGMMTAVTPRKIGEIVHRALRWWQFPTERDDLSAVLQSYAWEEGIVEPEGIEQAVKEARTLLQGFRSSSIFPLIDQAVRDRKHYPELPFIFQTDKRTIYGKLDALIQTPDGKSVIVDYKSSTMPNGRQRATLEAHAQRYYLQVGVYAAAVERMLGVTPAVYVHYIRYNQSIPVETEVWRRALEQLEPLIGDVMGDSDD
jgi:ATP-dependent helicase/nuclease subunit A